MEENFFKLKNQTLEIINSCFNISQNNACLHSLLLVDMTRKTTLWMNFILITIGFFTNLLVLIVFTRPELRKQSISIHTIGLAVSDIFLLSFPVSLKWLNEYDPDFYLFKTNFWCRSHGYFDIVSCCWSAWNVVGLSNERWMSICGPWRFGTKNPNKRSLVIVCIIPIVSFVAFIWYPFVIEPNPHNAEKISLNTFLEQDDCQPKNNFLLLFFGTIGIFLTYFIPFLMILFYNTRIIKKLSSRIKKRKQNFGNGIFKYDCEQHRTTKLKKIFSFIKFSSMPIERLEMNDTSSENVTLDEKERESSDKKDLNNNIYRKFSKKYESSPLQSFNITITSINDSDIINNHLSKYLPETSSENKKFIYPNNTQGLKARLQLNRDQRLKNDRAINIMLIAVSLAFLILTFPYQIIWIADQINKVFINYQLNKHLNLDSDVDFQNFFLKHVWTYQFVFYTIKDISLTIRNLNFSINFFLYSTMSNLFRKELNSIFQRMGFKNFNLFRNSMSNFYQMDTVSPTSKYRNKTTIANSSNN